MKRMIANKHGVQCDSCGIDVDLLAVTLARNLFWCHVEHSSDLLLVRSVDTHTLLGREAKVNDLELSVLWTALRCQLYVFRFDISMDVVHFVNME
jgi:hypothetical protein